MLEMVAQVLHHQSQVLRLLMVVEVVGELTHPIRGVHLAV